MNFFFNVSERELVEEFEKKEKKKRSHVEAEARGTLKWNERERCSESLTLTGREISLPIEEYNIFKRLLIVSDAGRIFRGEFNEKMIKHLFIEKKEFISSSSLASPPLPPSHPRRIFIKGSQHR